MSHVHEVEVQLNAQDSQTSTSPSKIYAQTFQVERPDRFGMTSFCTPGTLCMLTCSHAPTQRTCACVCPLLLYDGSCSILQITCMTHCSGEEKQERQGHTRSTKSSRSLPTPMFRTQLTKCTCLGVGIRACCMRLRRSFSILLYDTTLGRASILLTARTSSKGSTSPGCHLDDRRLRMACLQARATCGHKLSA